MTIAIIDYGMGNLGSVLNMMKKIGAPAELTNDPRRVELADKLILPGVGHFGAGMDQLAARGLIDPIRRHAEGGRPLLGICLGMQLLTEHGAEGDQPGLGLITGSTVPFDRNRLGSSMPVPHMGWNEARQERPMALMREADDEARFYFVHSYHVEISDPETTLLRTRYGYEFVSGFQKGCIFGAQFHPEKSHRHGMTFLRSFAAL